MILTLSAPFDTAEFLRPLPRFGYWGIVSVTTYAMGRIASTTASHWLGPRDLPYPVKLGLLSVFSALPISGVVVGLNQLTFGALAFDQSFWVQWLTVFFLGAVITAMIVTLTERLTWVQPEASAPPPPPLLDRLPPELRGPLVALSVEDHYVRVRTTQGETMVLMRLSDAIRETHPTEGLQVHRSHWVARAQVRSAARQGERAILTMTHGPKIPASRSHLPALRDAGLLAKGG